jgi:hypothetical protein
MKNVTFFPALLNPFDRVMSALEFANFYEDAIVQYKIETITCFVRSGDSIEIALVNARNCILNEHEKDCCLNCKKKILN